VGVIVTGIVCILADKLMGGRVLQERRLQAPPEIRRRFQKPLRSSIEAMPPSRHRFDTNHGVLIVTAVLTPILNAWMYKRVQAKRKREAEGAAATAVPATPAAEEDASLAP
jgi:hypothetical protein